MESWLKISILLCVFGVLKEFRPSEPYVTKYLLSPPMNFTLDVVSNDIYPISIYTTMASLVIVFLLTDFLRYKPIIIFDGICAVIVFAMLIVVRSLFLVQVLEVFYGLFMAGEVAYYTYIYAKVDKSHYQEVSGHTRAAYLVGRAISGIVSQVYILFDESSYYRLNFFSLTGATMATIWACFLPPVSTSLYFSRAEPDQERGMLQVEGMQLQANESKFKKCIRYLSSDFYAAFSNIYVLKWMFWWALATCGYYQVLSYVQVLWEEILKENNITANSELNGAVEATYTLLSAGASYSCGKFVLDWKIYGESILFICSLLIAILLFLMSQTNQILIAYGTYICYTVVYNGMITIANSEIATYLNPDSHGLIFGFTLFLALVFQSILTLVVNSLLSLNERTKFVIYSCYFGVLGLTFGVITAVKVTKHILKRKSNEHSKDLKDSSTSE